jgi:imidazolonepropionase-like amidohydrolase
MRRATVRAFGLSALVAFAPLPSFAQAPERPPDRPADEGEGPFERLILRGATVIDGTGAPPFGPVDVVVENDRIADIRAVGYPGVPIAPEARPAEGAREIDLHGKYLLPGFIDAHTHQHTVQDGQGVPVNYVHKLWMGHGITTIRDVGTLHGLDWLLENKERSARNEITAPRMEVFPFFGSGAPGMDMLSLFRPGGPFETAEEARAWVRQIAAQGADGIKFLGAAPEILRAALDEARSQGVRTTMHHAQMSVSQMNALQSAQAGLTSMEHWYGLPEALFEDRVVQDFPLGYNYQNEQHRFGEAGRLWEQAAEPGSDRWNAVMDSLLSLDFTIVPTFTIYLASRDLMRAVRADWHQWFTMPALWDFYRPNREAHGSYWFYWTTKDEVDWRRNYAKWMRFIEEYKNRGGRVAVGSDSGYIYQLYGFGFIQEMELLQEAGFHPLEVIWAATLEGAEALGLDHELGSIQIGKKADFVVVDEDPLENLKVLYGTGALRLNDETRAVERVGGVRWTIKDGIVYDAKALLRDVRDMVEQSKADLGIAPGPMPVVTVGSPFPN